MRKSQPSQLYMLTIERTYGKNVCLFMCIFWLVDESGSLHTAGAWLISSKELHIGLQEIRATYLNT